MLPRRYILFGLLAISAVRLISPVSAGVPSGNHLIMVTASDCPWCEAFEDEVGRGYPNTEEAKLLPLRRYDFYDPMPTDMVDLVPATMTPTFIVIKDGKEAGRIIGYPGHELFWWRLSEFTH